MSQISASNLTFKKHLFTRFHMCLYRLYEYNLVNTNHYLSVQKGFAELSVRLINLNKFLDSYLRRTIGP